MKIEIEGKIKVISSDNYLLVIEDEKGSCHFWLLDGTYDGYSKLCNGKEIKKDEK